MTSRRRPLHPALALAAALLAAGCSSSSDSTPAPTLTGLAVTPPTVGLTVGQSQQLTATGTWSDGSTQNVTASTTWVSSATTTATVTNGGLVSAVAPGTARITASYGGRTATRDVTVSAPVVTLTSISVGPGSAAVDVGLTLQLSVTGTFSDSSTQDLTAEATFVSSVTSVATVTSPGGLVTGVAVGTTTITATARGKTAARLVTVNAVFVPVAEQVVFWDGYGAGVSFRDFGGASNSVTLDATETFHGRRSIKFDVVAPGGSYSGGAWVASTPRDLHAYDALTFYAKATSAKTVNVTGIGDDAGAGVGLPFKTERAALPLGTDWQKYTIPIPDPAVLTSLGGLFHLADAPKGYTIYLADVIFESRGLAAGAASINLSGAAPSITVGGTTAVDPAQSQAVWAVAGDPEPLVTLRPVANRFFAFTSADTGLATVSADGTITGVAPGGPVNVRAKLRGADASGLYAVTVTPGSAYPATLPAIPPEPVGTSVYALYSSRTPPDGYAGSASDQSATVGTWRASWSAATGGDPYTITSTAGTAAPRRYVFTSGTNYLGVEFITSTAGNAAAHDVDVAALGLTHLHIDVWTPDNATNFQVQLVDFGADAAFGGAGASADTARIATLTAASTPPLATGTWLSYDLPLATAFPGLENAHHLAQLLLIAPNGGTMFVDNVYFHAAGPTPGPAPFSSLTFDGPAADYPLTGFGGGTYAVLAADPLGAGTVVEIVKTGSPPVWAGATIATGHPIPFTSTRKTFTLKVLAPATSVPFLLKVENSLDGAQFAEVNVTAPGPAGAWQTLTFDFGTPSNGTVDLAATYDKISVFPNFGTAADGTYDVDDLVLVP